MSKIIFLITVLVVATVSPKSIEKLQFRRVYVDPLHPIPEKLVPRITHGYEAVPHSIPSQAYLILTGDDQKWQCGGSLISPSFILTAGHCVADASSAEVYLGSHNIENEELTRLVIVSGNLIPHENFDLETITNDIGLVRLPAPVELNKYINTISLPDRELGHQNYEGQNARVSGWGFTIGGGGLSPVLREVNSTIISNNLCTGYYSRVPDYQICISGDGGVGSCSGDSGGPLVVENKQIGLVSYGIIGCMPGYPSGFTRVDGFFDWLQKHTDLKF